MKQLMTPLTMKEVVLYIFLVGNLFILFLAGSLDSGYLKILRVIVSMLGTSYYLFSLLILYQMSKISEQVAKRVGLTVLIASVLLSFATLVLIGISNPFYAFGIYLSASVSVSAAIALFLAWIVHLKLVPILKNHIRLGLKEYVEN